MATNKAQIELTAVDKTRAAIQSAQRGLDSLNRSATSIERSLAGLGGLVSIGAFVSFARSAVSAAAALDDMAEATGATVEGLSRLTTIARIGGIDIGQVETALIRLNKALFQQDDESSDAARAFQAIGVAAAQLRSQSPDRALEAVARAFAKFEDGASKTAAAVAIFGRSGAQLLPLLKDIAEQGDVVASVTREQAAEAEKFEKELRKLIVTAQNFGRSATLDVVRGLNSMVEAFARNRLEMSGWRAAYLEFAKLINATLSELPGPIGRAAEAQAEVLFGITKGRESGGRIGAAALEQQIAQLKALTAAARPQVPFTPKDSGSGKTGKPEDTTKALIVATEQILGLDREWLRFQDDIAKAYQEAETAASRLVDEQTAAMIKMAEQVLGIDEDAQRLQREIDEAYKKTKEANDAARELGLTFSSAFEDAIIGGKKLSDVLRGLAQDVLRIFARKTITEPVADFFSTIFGSIFGGARAMGGPVFAGSAYLVGERGPELFVPQSSGTIVPNRASALSIIQHIAVDARGADASVEARIRSAMEQTRRRTLADVQTLANRGGSFAASVGRK